MGAIFYLQMDSVGLIVKRIRISKIELLLSHKVI